MEEQELKLKVEDALEEIRPFLKKVIVRLEGACVGCTVNQMTLKSGVEMTIKKHAPQIEEVVNVE